MPPHSDDVDPFEANPVTDSSAEGRDIMVNGRRSADISASSQGDFQFEVKTRKNLQRTLDAHWFPF